MFQLLSKLFIKNHEDYTDPKVRQSYGILAGAVGILLNFLLFAAKALAGLLSHSIAITADAFNNLSDAGSSVITLIAVSYTHLDVYKRQTVGSASNTPSLV